MARTLRGTSSRYCRTVKCQLLILMRSSKANSRMRPIGRTLIPRYFSTVFEGGVTELHYTLRHSKESFVNSCITVDCDQCTMVTQHGKPMFTKVLREAAIWGGGGGHRNRSGRQEKDTKTPRHQDTRTPGPQATRPPRHQATRPPGHQDTKTPGHQATKTPGHQATRPPGHQDTKTPGHQDTKTPRHQDTRPPGHQDTRPPGHQDTKTPRHQDTRTPRHQDTKTPGHQNHSEYCGSKVQKFKSSQVVESWTCKQDARRHVGWTT
ncbi:hypothetical protein CRUP_014479 [Coryphaenoides rupestris]|nr:hypothetical protein CRUP_014479 [Coryphaenoides rupestris]